MNKFYDMLQLLQESETIDRFWQSLEAKAWSGRISSLDLGVFADALEENGEESLAQGVRRMHELNIWPLATAKEENKVYLYASEGYVSPRGRSPSHVREDSNEPWVVPQKVLRDLRYQADQVEEMSSGNISDLYFNSFEKAIVVMAKYLSKNYEINKQAYSSYDASYLKEGPKIYTTFVKKELNELLSSLNYGLTNPEVIATMSQNNQSIHSYLNQLDLLTNKLLAGLRRLPQDFSLKYDPKEYKNFMDFIKTTKDFYSKYQKQISQANYIKDDFDQIIELGLEILSR